VFVKERVRGKVFDRRVIGFAPVFLISNVKRLINK